MVWRRPQFSAAAAGSSTGRRSRHGQGGGRRCHVTFPAYTWQHRALAHNTTGSAIQCHGRRTAQLRLPILSLVPVVLLQEKEIFLPPMPKYGYFSIIIQLSFISGNIHKIIIYPDYTIKWGISHFEASKRSPSRSHSFIHSKGVDRT